MTTGRRRVKHQPRGLAGESAHAGREGPEGAGVGFLIEIGVDAIDNEASREERRRLYGSRGPGRPRRAAGRMRGHWGWA